MATRILLVEDEPGIADNVLCALQMEGIEATWCELAEKAMENLQAGNFDLVVLDVGLPDKNGFELCKDIRQITDIPIVFLTARSDEIDRIIGLEIGGDDYVTKPFSPRELVARIKVILKRVGRASPVAQDALFAVDEARMVIEYRGQALNLTRYEFRMLKLMIAHPERVFSREQLMQQVWEEPETSMDRAVDTHIKSLRAKLRAIYKDQDPIQTHRGMGYSLKLSVAA